MKVCNKCKIEKELTEFYKDLNKKDKLTTYCKICKKQTIKKYQEANKDKIKQYLKNNEIKIKAREKQYYIKNRKNILKQKKERYADIKEYKLEYQKKYRKNNEEVLRKKHTEYGNNRRKKDVKFRLACNIRSAFSTWLCSNKKSKKTFEYISYTKEELIAHLESLFQSGMTWENYGEWHIDHIKPLSLFDSTSEADMHEAWRKENLQPLWATDNLRKNNKY